MSVANDELSARAFRLCEDLQADLNPHEQLTVLCIAMAIVGVRHKRPGRSITELKSSMSRQLNCAVDLLHQAMEGLLPRR